MLTFGQTAAPVRLDVVWEGQRCTIREGGVAVPDDALAERGRGWRRAGRTVELVGAGDVPYRCIGSVIYRLQVAGVESIDYRIDRVPAEVELFVPAGRCRVRIDGRDRALAGLARVAAGWRAAEAWVHFRPDAAAGYVCVEQVLSILKQAGVERIGFTGNEAVAEPAP